MQIRRLPSPVAIPAALLLGTGCALAPQRGGGLGRIAVHCAATGP